MDKQCIKEARKIIYRDRRTAIEALAVRLVSCSIEAGWSAKGDILSNCSDIRFAETVFRRLPLSEILRVIDIIKYRLVP